MKPSELRSQHENQTPEGHAGTVEALEGEISGEEMKITCVSNHTMRLLLEPETVMEKAWMAEAAAQSEKGATTVLAHPIGDGSGREYVLEVGGKS